MPLAVGVRTTRVESTTWTSQSRFPVRPTGRVSVRIRSTAASTWVGLRTMKDSRPPAVEISPMSIRGSRRSSVETESSIAWRRCFCASRQSASSSKWLPPARSRPRLILYCGSQSASARRAWSRRSGSGSRTRRRARRPARRARLSSGEIRASVVRRLGRCRPTHVADGRFDHADLDAVGDLDLGLVVADLGHPAADPPPVITSSPFLTAAIAA